MLQSYLAAVPHLVAAASGTSCAILYLFLVTVCTLALEQLQVAQKLRVIQNDILQLLAFKVSVHLMAQRPIARYRVFLDQCSDSLQADSNVAGVPND